MNDFNAIARVDSPIGRLEITALNDRIVGLEIERAVGMTTGRATAGRAVGGAVGANPIPIIVPCHRVLGSDGRITGYSGGNGIPTKVWLLEHEGIAHR